MRVRKKKKKKKEKTSLESNHHSLIGMRPLTKKLSCTTSNATKNGGAQPPKKITSSILNH
jgi:hypothetical protein